MPSDIALVVINRGTPLSRLRYGTLGVWQKKEAPKPFMVRLYKKDIRVIANAARRMKCSKAAVIRSCITYAIAKAGQ
jgi:hypothetical protein